jgi:hypothetical protein
VVVDVERVPAFDDELEVIPGPGVVHRDREEIDLPLPDQRDVQAAALPARELDHVRNPSAADIAPTVARVALDAIPQTG